MVLVVGVLVARRFVTSQVAQRLERQTIDQDLEHASELQQRVLVPEPIDSSVFTVETAYYPARTVGGDFFSDHSLTLTARCSSLSATFPAKGTSGPPCWFRHPRRNRPHRRRIHIRPRPPSLLPQRPHDRPRRRTLRHLHRRAHHHGTARCVSPTPATPPYRNGVAMDLPGAIPLGIIPGTSYDVATVQLDAGDHLTFPHRRSPRSP